MSYLIPFLCLPESGVVIPAVSVDVVQKLFQAADKVGLSAEKRLEAGGVCIARMALHLLSGKSRYSIGLTNCPSNSCVTSFPQLTQKKCIKICLTPSLRRPCIHKKFFRPHVGQRTHSVF